MEAVYLCVVGWLHSGLGETSVEEPSLGIIKVDVVDVDLKDAVDL